MFLKTQEGCECGHVNVYGFFFPNDIADKNTEFFYVTNPGAEYVSHGYMSGQLSYAKI